jgi:hypothetical protein
VGSERRRSKSSRLTARDSSSLGHLPYISSSSDCCIFGALRTNNTVNSKVTSWRRDDLRTCSNWHLLCNASRLCTNSTYKQVFQLNLPSKTSLRALPLLVIALFFSPSLQADPLRLNGIRSIFQFLPSFTVPLNTTTLDSSNAAGHVSSISFFESIV